MCYELQVSSSPSDSMMSESLQRFQVISADPATPQRIQVPVMLSAPVSFREGRERDTAATSSCGTFAAAVHKLMLLHVT